MCSCNFSDDAMAALFDAPGAQETRDTDPLLKTEAVTCAFADIVKGRKTVRTVFTGGLSLDPIMP